MVLNNNNNSNYVAVLAITHCPYNFNSVFLEPFQLSRFSLYQFHFSTNRSVLMPVDDCTKPNDRSAGFVWTGVFNRWFCHWKMNESLALKYRHLSSGSLFCPTRKHSGSDLNSICGHLTKLLNCSCICLMKIWACLWIY